MAEIVIYGASWCPDCRRAKKFLGDQRIPYAWHDLETEPELASEVQARNDGKNIDPDRSSSPTAHICPSPRTRSWPTSWASSAWRCMHVYDLIIVGGGPAALTTAIYAARENLETLIIDAKGLGGQAGVTERLDNYPGFPEGIGGADLADRFVQQAQRYGVEMLQAVSVTRMTRRRASRARRRDRDRRSLPRARGADRHRVVVPTHERRGRGGPDRRGHPLLRHLRRALLQGLRRS